MGHFVKITLCKVTLRYFFTHTHGGPNKARGLGDSRTGTTVSERTLGNIICSNTNLDNVKSTKELVMKLGGPELPCSRRSELDWDGIVCDIKRDNKQ